MPTLARWRPALLTASFLAAFCSRAEPFASTSALAAPDAARGDAVPPAAKAVRSPGCDGARAAGGYFQREQLQVAEHRRSYHVRLPDEYQPSRAYPLVFRFHGYSGDGLSGGLEIERPAGKEAIIVGPDGLDTGWTHGNEQNDLAFFDAMYEAISRRYCVDLARVYSYGFSAGGGMSNLLACVRADKLRASAAIAGFDRGRTGCGKPVSGWFLHDRKDPMVPLSEGLHARDRLRQRNRCGARSKATTPGCVRYEDCIAPVVWCETNGRGHEIDGERAPERVWAFFRSS